MKRTVCISALIICIALVIGVVSSFVTFFNSEQSMSSVSASVELVFDGASEGKDPNGTSYRFDRIVTEERLEYALEKAGVETESEIKDIIACISVVDSYPSQSFPKSTEYSTLLDSDAYITLIYSDFTATKFTFVLNNAFDKSVDVADLQSILSELISKVREDFADDYSYGLKTENIDKYFNLDGYEYAQKVDILSARINQIETVSSYMNSLVPEFSVEDVTFNEITKQCETLRSVFINQLDINVSVNSICIDKDELISNYEYYIKNINLNIDKNTKELAYISSVLNSYERDDTLYISNGNSLTKIESNSGETYEALVSKKIALNFEIAEDNTEKNNYQQKIDNLKSKSADTVTVEEIDKDISDINSRIDALADKLNALLDAYNKQYVTENSIVESTVTVYRGSVLSAGFIVNAIKCIGPFTVIALCIVLALFMKVEIKKYKKENQ